MAYDLPRPLRGAKFFEDDKLFAALANEPITKGHVVVVWKKHVKDLHLLSRKEYEHLMNTVDRIRDVLLRVLHVKKVYLLYMDEANHVHWHLMPRYTEKGYALLSEKPSRLEHVALAERLRHALAGKTI